MTAILIILALVILNGVFAMSELAIVSSRKTLLQQRAEEGSLTAKAALELASHPNRFLATVQVGITLVGIIAGAFGGATLADDLAHTLSKVDGLTAYSHSIAFALIVGLTTYLSLVIGELVPKRLALRNAEGIAVLVARPMLILSRIFAPVIWFLGASTSVILWVMGSKPVADASVTEEEIIQMIRQGIQTGAFEASEEGLIENVFRLDDHRITEVMIPRKEVIWLDVNDPEAEWKQTVIEHGFSFYPVCNGSLDQVIGMVRAKDLLKRVAQGESFELISVMSQPLFIPESSRISHALELFKAAQTRAALVLDEHGGIEGMVTFRDILQEMVGDLEEGEPEATRREDGSWLLDGRMPLYKLFELFPDLELPPDEKGDYSTLAGFLLARFRHVPKAAEHLTYANLRFEIMDMDGVRIDKVLVTTAADESEQAGSG